jgi:type II secretory pathway pseudopilin PulG
VTLVELLIAFAVIAVLTGTAISLLSSGYAQTAAREAAQRVAADVVFAQADAIASHAPRTVVFEVDTETYGLYEDGGLLYHPVSKRPFTVVLGNLFRGTGIDLEEADFGGETRLKFDVNGIPASGGEVWLNAGGRSYMVTVSDLTGHVAIFSSEAGTGDEGHLEPLVL